MLHLPKLEGITRTQFIHLKTALAAGTGFPLNQRPVTAAVSHRELRDLLFLVGYTAPNLQKNNPQLLWN